MIGEPSRSPHPERRRRRRAGVSKTEVHELTIRYDDNSLAGRILDFLAKQQGLSRAEYAQADLRRAALPAAGAEQPGLPGPGRAPRSSGFLQDPKSLTIEIAPEAPVSGDDLMALVKTDARRDSRHAERVGHCQHARMSTRSNDDRPRRRCRDFRSCLRRTPAAADATERRSDPRLRRLGRFLARVVGLRQRRSAPTAATRSPKALSSRARSRSVSISIETLRLGELSERGGRRVHRLGDRDDGGAVILESSIPAADHRVGDTRSRLQRSPSISMPSFAGRGRSTPAT